MDKFQNIDKELTLMDLVLKKLLEKRNFEAFDKMCIKSNDILNEIIDLSTNPEGKQNTGKLISFLKRLLNICNVLVSYKEYLNSTRELEKAEDVRTKIPQNIRTLNLQKNDNRAA